MKASDNVFPKLIFSEETAPATPATGTVIVYAKNDGLLYAKDDAGTETPLGVSGSGLGDVVGPASSVDSQLVLFDGATGKLLKDSGYSIATLREFILTTTENVQTGTAYTLVLSDAFKLVCMNNAAASTLTVPPNSSVAFPVGTRIDIGQDGAGQVTVVAGSGVTVRTPETLKLRKQFAKATLIKRDTDTWDLEGNLEASA